MKVSEKSLELNIGAELLGLMRNSYGMPKAYLRGLTQREEKQEGVDFFLQLDPATRIFAFQFKAPKGRFEDTPYLYTLRREQHSALFDLAQISSGSVFYVFPFFVTPAKLHQYVPNLGQDTWLLDINPMSPGLVFGGNQTKVVRCGPGSAQVNPEYRLLSLNEVPKDSFSGIPVGEFALWYNRQRKVLRETERRRDPWLVRGLRVAVVTPAPPEEQ